MKRTTWIAAIVAVVSLFCAIDARALEIGGTLITEYRDRTGGNENSPFQTPSIQTSTQHGQFRVVQSNLRITHDFSDMNHFGAEVTTGGGPLLISEAWIQSEGLPFDGSVTLGRFYKPLGAPLQTIGLTYPALLFHTSPVLGAKFNMEYYPWRWEVGVANNNDLSATGTFISNSAAFGRPLAAASSQNKEAYVFLGWRDGGEWGALDANIGFTYGAFTAADRAVLRGLVDPAGARVYPTGNEETTRNLLDIALDYTYGPWRLSGEYARTEEGWMQLTAFSVNGSYRTGKFNWLVGYDRLYNDIPNRPKSVPASWRRGRWDYGVAWEYHPQLTFQLEYEQNTEDLSVAAGSATMGGLRRRAIANDAIFLQAVASF